MNEYSTCNLNILYVYPVYYYIMLNVCQLVLIIFFIEASQS